MTQFTTQVKICGLTRAEDAAHASAIGAAYIGVILAGGPRVLDIAHAGAVLGPVRHNLRRVAVFGDQSVEKILQTTEALALDVVQLHHTANVDVASRVMRTGRIVWPVIRLAGTTLPVHAASLAALTGWLVLDTFVAGQLGGTGQALDWSGLVQSLEALRWAHPNVRIVLAGGLTPANVGQAIELLSPDVVDVSSGIEQSPGIKDWSAMQAFANAVLTTTGNRQ